MINDILLIADRQSAYDGVIRREREKANSYHIQYRAINHDELIAKSRKYLKAYREKNAGMIAETQRSYYQRKKAKQND